MKKLRDVIKSSSVATAICLLMVSCDSTEPDVLPIDPLVSAVSAGDYAEVVRLIESGIEVDERSHPDYFPITYFAVGGNNSVADTVRIKQGKDPQSIENLPILKALLEAGADPNAPGIQGGTPLVTAVYNNRIGSIWLLLQYGADPRLENELGHTASYYGRLHGYEEAVQLLELCLRVNCKKSSDNKENDTAVR